MLYIYSNSRRHIVCNGSPKANHCRAPWQNTNGKFEPSGQKVHYSSQSHEASHYRKERLGIAIPWAQSLLWSNACNASQYVPGDNFPLGQHGCKGKTPEKPGREPHALALVQAKLINIKPTRSCQHECPPLANKWSDRISKGKVNWDL